MRATPSSILPRLAVLASIVASGAGLASAYDAEAIGDNLQPYIGGWVGGYQVNTDDLRSLPSRYLNSGSKPKPDLFLQVVPAGGISLGVAYGRMHMGANLGYQMVDGGATSAADRSTYLLQNEYHYDVIPLDVNLDLALLPNEYPVNFLIGGSVGVGFVRIQNPLPFDSRIVGTDTLYYPRENTWETNNFTLATGYIGARINLARRLNLEGQLGYRYLATDGLVYENGPNPMQVDHVVRDSSGNQYSVLKPIEMDLSGAYARVDLRWTFASKAEKERSAALLRRREALARLGQVAFVDPRD